MSFGTTYFTPAPIGREMDFGAPTSRQSFHQRTCSGGAYAEEMFMIPKLGSDPRDFYVEDDKDLASAGPGAKQPRDRMRLNRILNASEQQQQSGADQYQGYPCQDNSPTLQSFQTSGSLPVSTFPVTSVASLSPMTPDGSPVPSGIAPTLATMSSSMSPMTSFSTMSQPNLIFEDVMPYSYNISQYPAQAYSFKHTGNARPLEQSVFSTDATHSHSPQGHHYSSQSPDPSGSPAALAPFPQRSMNALVDHQYPTPDSPPSTFYHAQHQMPSPYSVGSHSPIANGPYTSAYITPEAGASFTPTPPTTPHYGFSAPTDNRYQTGAMSLYGDHFALQAQPLSRPNRSGNVRTRKAPYESRTARTADGLTGVTPPPRRFQCPECEKAFPTKGELASHSRCHLKVPAFLCSICGRPFKRRTDYVRHVRNVHEEVGRYGCNQCGERFGRLDKLKRHDKRGCGADKEEEDEQQ
ncbi:hypothetical protein BX616_003695 [Lobosporangium transversale]|uniref:C2H2-type domain-containing protein n=1 Tax=Lobosporangium transversale TaxID=64571 RepID=A0A1Y2GA72_9FUNG|nr:hypothetical protein BCR41DRAFT_361878 [Lobosporangium transversale]KAF9916453.1 hypothetical protein BX616_003695 [Lobosporangium transversale]ORZ05315.1 hypothetical protein BCR41DRAFT_361878 [Lobosporangium transversale]|eukprot:XP_021877007.1 hypothetical protein BCR41DRAFT_361878 [Lobosporangium transversale]